MKPLTLRHYDSHTGGINRKNRKATLTFAEEHVGWREENWSKFHFSDESKFNWFGLGLRGNILFGIKLRKERLNLKCVMKSVKGGGWSAIVWGMFSTAGVGPHTATWQSECKYYQNLFQQHSAVPSLQASPNQPAKMCWSHSKQGPLPFILISDSCNSSKC